ncbi:MAG: hypothetical protein M3Y50_11880 [Acidobacteriota bacterium]|nr:hypothetical protein [Acidobacteriota bacterium]
MGAHTTKLSSCFACAIFMEATGYPASSTHLGRGECWAPLYPESPTGGAIDMTAKQNIARKTANAKWEVYCKMIVDSILACDGFRAQLKNDTYRASFDQLRSFVRGKDASAYANLILDALTYRKSETDRLLATLT